MITLSMYGRIFNQNCPMWDPNREVNLMFLRHTQDYFNELLKLKGKVYLSDVYEQLGFPVTDASRCVGWCYYEGNVMGDNYIDFELPKEFTDDGDSDIPLDFNVDGII